MYQPVVNEHYLYVQCIMDATVTLLLRNNLFRKKERASRLRHPRAVSFHQNPNAFIPKM